MKIIDLTLTIKDGFMSFPGHPKVKVEEVSTFENSKKKYEEPCNGFESRLLSLSDHSGTHIDAPLHFIEGGDSASSIPLNQVVCKCFVINLEHLKEENEEITYDMLEEACNKKFLEESKAVIIKSRKGSWGDSGFFNEAAYHPSSSKWFIENGIELIGIDLANIDTNSNLKRDVHLSLLSRNILIVENLVNIDQLPTNEIFEFISAPLKIDNATGSPVRAFAILNGEE